MAHRRCAGIVLPALAALKHPARLADRVRALCRTADARRLAFRIVAAIALFAGHGITREAMTVALATSSQKRIPFNYTRK